MKDLEIQFTQGFAGVLQDVGGNLALSVYHAGKLILISSNGERIKITPISFPKPMGIEVDGDRMAIATKTELHWYANNPDMSKRIRLNDKVFEKIYFPRITYHTGPLDTHDIRFVKDEIWAVNTRFSCLCSFDAEFNFRPRWKPPFISTLEPTDKCHLNGMVVEHDQPVYVTALGASDKLQGWRGDITSGGVILSVPGNEILAGGLGMPHSPAIYKDKVYLLESAKGALIHFDRGFSHKEEVLRINGLTRGMAIAGNTGFIGISKIREKSSTFSKLEERLKSPKAGIVALDMDSGMILGSLYFNEAIEEIYDIRHFEAGSVGIMGTYDERQYGAISTPMGNFWKSRGKQENDQEEAGN